MNSFIVNHAVSTIWCAPGIDTHLILELARLTPDNGARELFRLTWDQYRLPDNDLSYHIYMVGNIPLDILGIKEITTFNQWIPIVTLSTNANTVINIFTGNGYDVGLVNVFINISMENEILLAVSRDHKDGTLDNSAAFMRIYKNDYYESDRRPGEHLGILHSLFSGGSDEQLSRFISDHNNLNRLGYGKAYLNHRGFWYDTISPETIDRSSYLTSYFDGSVNEVVSIPVIELPTFLSTLDNKNKYLVHLPKQVESIYYYVNVDFYLGTRQSDNFSGIRLHKSEQTTVRQVTHNDYSIDTGFVQFIKTSHYKDIAVEDLHLNIVVRHGRYRRELYYTRDKLRGLYKLPDKEILRAMSGIHSNLPFWQSSHLESALYPEIMSTLREDIVPSDVFSCYGYYGTCKALANAMIVLDPPGSILVSLPPVLASASVVGEYSPKGDLLGHYQVTNQPSYITNGGRVGWLECIPGKGTTEVYQGWDRDSLKIDPLVKYKGYSAAKLTDGTLGQWVDRSNGGHYSIKDGELIWSLSGENHLRTVIGEDTIYYIDTEVNYDIGIIMYKMFVQITDEAGASESVPMTLPMDTYRVWINNKALIGGLDFTINGNILFIVNKAHLLSASDTLNLKILAYGFCLSDDVTTLPPYETGYVKWNKLFFNERYDYREDWMDRYVVAGRVYPRELLSFAEDGGASLDSSMTDVTLDNGLPYAVEMVYPPLPTNIDVNIDREREIAQERGDAINDFLTEFIPITPPDKPSIIPSKYKLYSPFLALPILDLINDLWILPDGPISDEKLDSLVSGYKWLLQYDPIILGLDTDYLDVHPHPFHEVLYVTQREYSILERLSINYLEGKVDLTPHLGIN